MKYQFTLTIVGECSDTITITLEEYRALTLIMNSWLKDEGRVIQDV